MILYCASLNMLAIVDRDYEHFYGDKCEYSNCVINYYDWEYVGFL